MIDIAHVRELSMTVMDAAMEELLLLPTLIHYMIDGYIHVRPLLLTWLNFNPSIDQ